MASSHVSAVWKLGKTKFLLPHYPHWYIVYNIPPDMVVEVQYGLTSSVWHTTSIILGVCCYYSNCSGRRQLRRYNMLGSLRHWEICSETTGKDRYREQNTTQQILSKFLKGRWYTVTWKSKVNVSWWKALSSLTEMALEVHEDTRKKRKETKVKLMHSVN